MAEPDIRRGTILWPNEPGANPNAVYAQVRAAAMHRAESSITEGDMVFDLQIETSYAATGTNAEVMEWTYSYQVIPPGGGAAVRPR